jgi:hypothetical protein
MSWLQTNISWEVLIQHVGTFAGLSKFGKFSMIRTSLALSYKLQWAMQLALEHIFSGPTGNCWCSDPLLRGLELFLHPLWTFFTNDLETGWIWFHIYQIKWCATYIVWKGTCEEGNFAKFHTMLGGDGHFATLLVLLVSSLFCTEIHL